MTARGAIAGVCLWAALAALAGCGKQEGALSPNPGAAHPEPGAGIPTESTAPNVPTAAGESAATGAAGPRQTGGEDGRSGSPAERLFRVAGAPFFHGDWTTEGGEPRRSDRSGTSPQQRSKSGAKVALAADGLDRQRAPAIRQMLRSIQLSLSADSTIRLDANGATQTGQYTVKVIDAKTVELTARFESGEVAARDRFELHAQPSDRRGRARMQVIVPGSEPMMMIERDRATGRR